MATVKPELKTILDKYGINPRDASQVWDCRGTLVLYHKAFEIIGAKEAIRFDPPQMIRTERDEAVVLVVGHMGERAEWSFGEAAPANCKNTYPYAMAEKRAKDRVIAKLVGLSAYIHSEDEAEEFKSGERKAAEVAETKPEAMPEPSKAEPGKPVTHTLKPEFVKGFWDRGDYTVNPPTVKGAVDWVAWWDWMWQLGGAAPTLDCIAKLQDDNKTHIAGFRLVSQTDHRKLLDHFALIERGHGGRAAA